MGRYLRIVVGRRRLSLLVVDNWRRGACLRCSVGLVDYGFLVVRIRYAPIHAIGLAGVLFFKRFVEAAFDEVVDLALSQTVNYGTTKQLKQSEDRTNLPRTQVQTKPPLEALTNYLNADDGEIRGGEDGVDDGNVLVGVLEGETETYIRKSDVS